MFGLCGGRCRARVNVFLEPQLVKKTQKEPRFGESLAQHRRVLFRYALLQLRDSVLAEDAVQETLLAALQAEGGFAGRSSLRTWLIGILKHKIADLRRRAACETSLDESEGIGLAV